MLLRRRTRTQRLEIASATLHTVTTSEKHDYYSLDGSALCSLLMAQLEAAAVAALWIHTLHLVADA